MRKIALFINVVFLVSMFVWPTHSMGQEKKVVVITWGSYWEEAIRKGFGDPFEKETGIKVIYSGPYDLGKLKAMVEAGRIEWDVGMAGPGWVASAESQTLLEPIDYTIVKKDQLYPYTVHKYAVGGNSEAICLGYRTDKYGKNPPKSWKDFWDAKAFPGRRILPKRPDFVMEIALLADGVDPAKLYPLDIDRAFKSLDRIKPDVHVWWTQGAQTTTLMKDGEVDMAATYNGRVSDLKGKFKAPVDYVWNQALYYQSNWFVVKGTPRKQEAMKFVEFTNRPEGQAIYAKMCHFGPTNPKAFEFIDIETAKELPSYPENYRKAVIMSEEYWGPNREKVLERMIPWLMK